MPSLSFAYLAQCAPALGSGIASRDSSQMARSANDPARAGSLPRLLPVHSDLARTLLAWTDYPSSRPSPRHHRPRLIAGFSSGADAKLAHAQGPLSGGKLVHVHRKVYPPDLRHLRLPAHFCPGDVRDLSWEGYDRRSRSRYLCTFRRVPHLRLAQPSCSLRLIAPAGASPKAYDFARGGSAA